ncbi:MAG: hypothetical protein ACM359_05570, partial [Bacillota bacterium]
TGVSLHSTDGQTWILSGLSSLTQEAGTYTLTLVAKNSGIADLSGNALAADVQGSFTNSRLVMADISGGLSLLKVNGTELQIYRPGQLARTMQLSDLRQLDLGGMIRIEGQLATAGKSLAVNIHGDAQNPALIELTDSQQWTTLTMTGLTFLEFSKPGKYLKLNSLDLSPDATLDLASNDLIVTATPETKATTLAALSNAIKSARGVDGQWLGNGLTSSMAQTNNLTGLAILLNDQDGSPILSSFAGQPVTENDILVKYTWNGDVDLNGVVDGDDYFLIDAGFISGMDQYRNGDVDLNGVIDGDDYFLVDSAFISQNGVLAGKRVRPVQELFSVKRLL